MPATLSQPRDEWNKFGQLQFASGVSRGTSSSSGVFSFRVDVNSGIQREVIFALAFDEATRLRNTVTGGGPSATQATWYSFQPLTPSGRTARFRVRLFDWSSGNYSSFTLASAVSGITARWIAFGH